MQYPRLLTTLAAVLVFRATSLAATSLTVPDNGRVGRNLEAFASIRLSEAAPASGLPVTVTSGDPSRLLLSKGPDQAGSKAITLDVQGESAETPDFYFQALGDTGTVTYVASAPGYPSATGTITLAPSGLMLTGPMKASSFRTTTGTGAKLLISSAVLDEAGNFGEPQPIAGGLKINISLTSSDPRVGSAKPLSVTMSGGSTSAISQFHPVGAGKATMTLNLPPGFKAPATMNSVTAIVELPGIGITGEINLGKDLEVEGVVALGEAAPATGLDVHLVSDDPKRLVLAPGVDKPGTGSLTVHVPAGESRVSYWVQSLADSGTVTYSATAPGYRPRTAPVTLTPSGVMVVYSPYGPPDEAQVLRPLPSADPRPFTAFLSEHKPIHLTVWTVYLDPKTMRGADITAQRLRPGVSGAVKLENSNPAVAKVADTVMISSASGFSSTEFIPISPGKTTISVVTPPGFATPTNATSVTATIKQ